MLSVLAKWVKFNINEAMRQNSKLSLVSLTLKGWSIHTIWCALILCYVRNATWCIALLVLAEKNGLSFLETSALDSTNVETAFQTILTGKTPARPAPRLETSPVMWNGPSEAEQMVAEPVRRWISIDQLIGGDCDFQWETLGRGQQSIVANEH